jgi:hypothetical protein
VGPGGNGRQRRRRGVRSRLPRGSRSCADPWPKTCQWLDGTQAFAPPGAEAPTPENPHLQYLWFIYAHVPMWSPGRATAGRLP